jgi:hypothetical protein
VQTGGLNGASIAMTRRESMRHATNCRNAGMSRSGHPQRLWTNP